MPDIFIQSADGSKQRFHLGKERVTIGRSRESDIFLPDQWLSRHHAEIQRTSEGFFIQDLRSKNGTLLNGERVKDERRLRHGDVIALGEHYLTFSSREEVLEEEVELEGTRIFSARELSDIKTKPAFDPEELRRQNKVLRVLNDATGDLLPHRPLPELFEKVLNLLFDAVAAERGAILLLEGTPLQPVVKASRSRLGQPIASVPRSISRKVLNDMKSVLIPNILEDAAFSSQDSILSTGIRSAMCAPLWYTDGAEDSVIGLVYLDSLLGAHSFTEEDLTIVTALANLAAVKIEQVRLLEDRLEKRSLEEDMRMAAEIQRGLLPGAPPEVPGYELTGINFPCRAVGGDYYDFVCEQDRLLFALGDVSGKGTGAALIMTVLRAAVRDHWGEPDPAQAMAHINRTVLQNIPANKYITFFMGRLDPVSGDVSYVNAGHNPPLLVRAGGQVDSLEEGGVVLGLVTQAVYEEGRARLERGDTLVVYSDGVSETWNTEDEEFGEARLIELAVRERHRSAEGLQAAILKELEAFAPGVKATDDRTLIVLKRT